MEITGCMFVKSHMFIETYGWVVAVYVQFYRKGARMDRFQVGYSLFDNETPDSRTCREGKEYIFWNSYKSFSTVSIDK